MMNWIATHRIDTPLSPDPILVMAEPDDQTGGILLFTEEEWGAGYGTSRWSVSPDEPMGDVGPVRYDGEPAGNYRKT